MRKNDGIVCDTAASVEMRRVSLDADDVGVYADSCSVTIADSTLKTYGFGGAVVQSTNATVTVENSTVTNSMVMGQTGILAAGTNLSVKTTTIRETYLAIDASNGSTTVERALLIGNAGGGMRIVDSFFTIRNNVIVNNGGPMRTLGGVEILNNSALPTQIFEFNTLAGNVTESGAAASGVSCTVTQAAVAHSNIIWSNDGNGAPAVAGNCSWEYSNIQGGVSGTGNIDMDPKFVNAPAGNYQLTAGSPCRDAGDPNATTNEDYAGAPRPVGGRHDMGALEFAP
jgi:hypothetical protein